MAAWRRVALQTELIRLASGQSRTIHLGRPVELTDEQKAAVKRHPMVQKLWRKWQNRKAKVKAHFGSFSGGRGTEMYAKVQNCYSRYHSVLRATKESMINLLRQQFDIEQPVRVALWQTRGLPFEMVQQKDQPAMPPGQRHVFNLLFTLLPYSPVAEAERRADIADAVARVQPGNKTRLREIKVRNRSALIGTQPLQMSAPVPMYGENLQKIQVAPGQCFWCMIHGLESKFNRTSSLRRHIARHHFGEATRGGDVRCPDVTCQATLAGAIDMENHIIGEHTICC
ncbi:hypothetical protein Plec18167_009670 [Paecilomyces lecythidis]|uniref:C2H2-type domain-containing protein n=1 Tax=Paecilomyces lecythidis TaxID=3004212 RepID=A0ABR3WLZ7_9EURO